jgi:ATP-dependent DNA ligase
MILRAPTVLSSATIAPAQVEFTEWTTDGHLSHSKFVGLREDKAALDVIREG